MPTLVERLLEIVGTLRARGVGVLLVEQKIDAALRVADAVALMENGTIPYRGAPDELAARPDVLLRHLGVRRSPGPGEGRFRGAGREPATEP
jgi:branched-chain amino acid transport system ATP-binding protein